jgi:ABC-2 type transport system ATP-binding protein
MSLEIRALTKTYPGASGPAVRNVDLDVVPGTISALIGPNGAGKTTLISIVMGLVERDGGTVELDGEDLLGRRGPELRHGIGYAPQEEAIFPTLTVEDNLRLYAELAGLRGREAQRRIEEVAEAFLVGDLLARKAGALSGGQRRRINNAIALLGRPRLVILDEPTAGVDPATRSAVLDVVRRLADDGCGVCYSTHYLPEVTALDATVTLLDRGAVIARGTVPELLAMHTRSGIELRFDGGAPEIAGLPGRVQRAGDLLRIEVADPARHLSQVVAALGDHGHRLIDVQLSQPDLDSVFLMLTGREYAGDDSGGELLDELP